VNFDSSTLILLGVLVLLAWRTYSRVKRMVGRQRSTARRHWIGIVLYSALSLLLLGLFALGNAESLAALLGGLAIGAGLAVLGLRLTKFEATAEGYFYTPNAHIGIALSVLFVCRIAYRVAQVTMLHPPGAALNQPGAAPDFARSPLTLIVFGMLAGYFVAYAVGMLRWRARVRQERAAKKALQDAEPQAAATADDATGGN
jgi:phosphatidylserine synthase